MKVFENGQFSESTGEPLPHDEWVAEQNRIHREEQQQAERTREAKAAQRAQAQADRQKVADADRQQADSLKAAKDMGAELKASKR